MAVKIRLTRMGKKKQPSYRVVVMDSRKPRDGKYIEQIGFYDPRQDPSLIQIDNERALDWLNKGAQPTERAQKLLEISGAWTQFRVAKGDIHTVGETAPTAAPEPAVVATAAADMSAAEASPVEATPHEANAADAAAEAPEAESAEDAAAEEPESAETSNDEESSTDG